MQKKSVYISAALHVAIFIAATVSLPWLRKDFVIPQPISVELVDVSAITQTNKVAPKPDIKKEDKPPELPKPPPAAKNTSNDAVTPVKEDKKDDKKELKKDEQLVDKNAILDKKKDKKDDKKKKVTDATPQRDFSSVLKNLEDQKDTPQDNKKPDLKLDEKQASTEGQNAPLGANLTMSEEDALRHQLEKCWNVPFGAKDAENMIVELIMTINPDRTIQSARVADTSRYNSDSFFRAAADSAMRAVRSPLCSPFELPPDKYDTWKTTTVTFNPSEMF
jgi:outer membrane biosynthesis protein TonB